MYYPSLDRSGTTRPDSGDEAGVAPAHDQVEKDKAEVVQSLQALMNILQAVPKVTALMASRPALAPLLNCIEPICRFAALWSLNDALQSLNDALQSLKDALQSLNDALPAAGLVKVAFCTW